MLISQNLKEGYLPMQNVVQYKFEVPVQTENKSTLDCEIDWGNVVISETNN